MLRQFFATADDLLPVFDRIESKRSLAYTRTGLFESPDLDPVGKGANISTLGQTVTEPNAVNCPAYLVTPADIVVRVRQIPQRTGGMRYAVDQLANPDSAIVSHGGFFSPEILLYGSVGTASDSRTATALYRAFANAIAKHFVRIKAFWVGPQAGQLLHHGIRLAIGANSPREYDLAP